MELLGDAKDQYICEILLKGLLYTAQRRGDKPEQVADLESKLTVVFEGKEEFADLKKITDDMWDQVFQGQELDLAKAVWYGLKLRIIQRNLERASELVKQVLTGQLKPDPEEPGLS